MSNFFRDDLNLDGKWWHRFFKIIYISLFIFIFCYFSYKIYDGYENFHIQTAKLSSRVTNDLNEVTSLKKEGEIFSASNYQTEDFPTRVFCSKELHKVEKIQKIITETHIVYLYIPYTHEKININEFSKYIKEN